jgi:hypothetical protein
MSHFTKVKTKMTDGEIIKTALTKLGYKVLPGTTVAGFMGNTIAAEFKIKPNQTHYEIGFKNTPSGYELVADWSMMRLDQSAFSAILMQGYGRIATVERLAAEGYELIEEAVDEIGEIRLLLRRTLS